MYFAGWIPTAIGRLSFTTIGRGKHPSRCWKAQDGEQFVVIQRRDLLDVLVPFAGNSVNSGSIREIIAKLVIRKTGRFFFVMTANLGSKGEICFGHVYLVPALRNRILANRLRSWIRHDGGMKTWRNEFEERIQDISSFTAKY